MMNGYTDARMNLNEVCNWLTVYGQPELATILNDSYKYHTWTVDGMLRTDVIKEIFDKMFGERAFKLLQCDVTTALSFVPDYEAHVD